MVSEKPSNMTTIQETKTQDSQATATSQPSPMEKPTKDPSNPAPARGDLSHPGLSSLPHIMTDQQVIDEFESSREQGLSVKQAEAARQKWGDNIIQPPPKPSVSDDQQIMAAVLGARARAKDREITRSRHLYLFLPARLATETSRTTNCQRHDDRAFGSHGRLVRYSGLDRCGCYRSACHLERFGWFLASKSLRMRR